MPIRVEKSIDDPIITFTFGGVVDPETVQEANAQLAEAINSMGMLYVMVDLRDTEMTQGEAIALIEVPDAPSFMEHPRIRTAQALDVAEPRGITHRPEPFVESGCGVRGVKPGVVRTDHVQQQKPARCSDEVAMVLGLGSQGGPILPGSVRS